MAVPEGSIDWRDAVAYFRIRSLGVIDVYRPSESLDHYSKIVASVMYVTPMATFLAVDDFPSCRQIGLPSRWPDRSCGKSCLSSSSVGMLN